MALVLKSQVMYWTIVSLTACLLLSGWSMAISNLIHGTTVVS